MRDILVIWCGLGGGAIASLPSLICDHASVGYEGLSQTPVGLRVDRHGSRCFLIGGALLMSPSIAATGLANRFGGSSLPGNPPS